MHTLTANPMEMKPVSLPVILGLSLACSVSSLLLPLLCRPETQLALSYLPPGITLAVMLLMGFRLWPATVLIGYGCVHWTGMLGANIFAPNWLNWYVSSVTSLLLLDPFLQYWGAGSSSRPAGQVFSRRETVYGVVLLGLSLGGAKAGLFSASSSHPYFMLFAFLFIFYAIHAWGTTAAMLLAAIGLGNVLTGSLLTENNSLKESFFSLEIFLSVQAVIAMVLCATLTERRPASEPWKSTEHPVLAGDSDELGLATALGLIKQHHNLVELKSELRKKNQFRVARPPGHRQLLTRPGNSARGGSRVADAAIRCRTVSGMRGERKMIWQKS